MTLGDVVLWLAIGVIGLMVSLTVLAAVVLFVGARALSRGEDIA